MIIKKLKQNIQFRSRKDGRKKQSETKAHPSANGSSISNPAPVGDQVTQARPPSESSPPSSEDRDTPIRQLWNLAYENLREEDEGLIVDYETKLCGDLSAGLSFMLGSKVSLRDRMQAILEHKMNEINRDIWRLKFGSTEVQVRDLVQPVLDVVNRANSYITRAVSANPYASMAWAGVSLLLPLLLNPSEQIVSLAQGLEYISSLIVQSWMWEDLYARRYEWGTSQHKSSPESHTAYKDTLEKLYRQILKFQATSYCYYASNTSIRLGQDITKWNEWDKLLDGVKDKERVFAEVSVSWRDMKFDEECLEVEGRHREAMRRWHTIGTDVSGLREAVQNAREEKARDGFLDWLCTVDPSDMYNTARDKHESGTCGWLINDCEEFKTWEESPSSLLWLHGKAGIGKSILSSSVVKHLRDRYTSNPETAFAYFFFSFSDLQKQKVNVMLASLVKQLYTSRPDTPQPIENLGEYKKKGERPDTGTLEDALIATARGFSSVSIVIDALDECPTLDGERRKLLRSLGRIVAKMPHNLHIFCTSRAEPDINTAIRAVLSPPLRAAIDLTENQMGINHDIDLCIDSVFASADYSVWPDDLKAEAKTLLIEKADGMFQYIFCQFEALQDLPSVPRIRKALQQLPTGLDATYDRLLQSLDARHQGQILNLLKWLAVSQRALTLGELADTLIVRTDPIVCVDMTERLLEPRICLKYLSSLVVTQKKNIYILQDDKHTIQEQTLVRLAHFSIREYLMSDRIAKGPAALFSFAESDAHLHVALTCLAYHLHHNRLIWDELPDPELAVYAAENWMWHLEVVPREIWPTMVIHLATRALAVRSKSLGTIIMLRCRWMTGMYRQQGGIWGNKAWEQSHMFKRPQCFTARVGCLKLTELLLCSDPGTNRYSTKWDFDAALEAAVYEGDMTMVRPLIGGGAHSKTKSDKLGNALVMAAYRGHTDIVGLLLNNGANIDAQHSKLGSALQAAASHDHLQVVQLLVNRGANVNLPPNKAGCAITSAVPTSDTPRIATEILQFLLDSGANINGQGGTHRTALHKAATNIWYAKEQFHILLERGADVNVQGGEYGYPLQAMCTIRWGNRAEVELLLDKGADVNAQGGEYGNALQAACYCHINLEGINGSTVELLLERGADINAQGGALGTALQAACTDRCNRDLVEFLLEKGADLHLQGGKYGNGLQAACVFRGLDTARLLLERGVDVNAPGGEYGSALQAAAAVWLKRSGNREVLLLEQQELQEQQELLKLLISNGANVDERSGYYGTALQAACFSGNIDSVGLLLDHGAQVNAEGGEYGTALQAACWAGDYSISRLLIEHGADVHLQGGVFGSAWHAAAATLWIHNNSLLQLLLDHGVDVNDARGAKHPTALHAALGDSGSTSRCIHTVFFLLSRGADVNINPGTYGSPLQSACAFGDDSAKVRFLLQTCPNIDVNASGGVFGSALQAAAHSGQIFSVKLLLDKGAHIDARGGKYGSALNAAIFEGFWDIVEFLLLQGAKPDSQYLPRPDQEWLARVQEEDGEEAVARYRVFWDNSEGVV